ncbi:MAG: hypothetical protein ABR592_10830 [Nitriliruptorales bacterium]
MVDDRRSQGSRARSESERSGAREAAPTEPAVAHRTPFTQQVGRVIVGVAAVLFLVFAFVNSQRVTFDWIFGETEAMTTPEGVIGGVPLIVLLLGAFLLGAVVGAGLLWRTQRTIQAPARPRRTSRP